MAKAGYAGANLTFTASRHFADWWVGAFVRYDRLHGAVFSDSPLLTARDNVWAGFAVSRVLLRSKATVARDD